MAKRKRLGPPSYGIWTAGPPPAEPAHAPPIASVAGEAAATAALSDLAETLTRAREAGRMVLELPLGEVVADHLVRDRIAFDADEMQALVQSLRDRGQQVPIEVTALGPGRWGLISGWRRLEALKRLAAETGEARFGTVLALVRRPAEAGEAYRAMVEENEIRVGLSHYERARIAVKAVEEGIFGDLSAALGTLFATASKAKRSKIRSFARVVAALDGALAFPQAMGERLGLRLAQWLEADAGNGPRLAARLAEARPATAEAEQAVILEALAGRRPPRPDPRVGPGERCALAQGVELRVMGDGSVMLAGPGVDDAFRTRLLKAFRAGGV